MKKLLNTLYITDETAYLSLDGENIVIKMTKSRCRAAGSGWREANFP